MTEKEIQEAWKFLMSIVDDVFGSDIKFEDEI